MAIVELLLHQINSSKCASSFSPPWTNTRASPWYTQKSAHFGPVLLDRWLYYHIKPVTWPPTCDTTASFPVCPPRSRGHWKFFGGLARQVNLFLSLSHFHSSMVVLLARSSIFNFRNFTYLFHARKMAAQRPRKRSPTAAKTSVSHKRSARPDEEEVDLIEGWKIWISIFHFSVLWPLCDRHQVEPRSPSSTWTNVKAAARKMHRWCVCSLAHLLWFLHLASGSVVCQIESIVCVSIRLLILSHRLMDALESQSWNHKPWAWSLPNSAEITSIKCDIVLNKSSSIMVKGFMTFNQPWLHH